MDAPRYKIGIVEWANPLPGPSGMKLASECGVQGMELDFGDYEQGFPLSNPRIQKVYLENAKAYNVALPAMALNALNKHGMSHSVDSFDGAIAMETIHKGIRAAHEMGIPVVQCPSFDSGNIRTEADFYNTCEKLKAACDMASAYGITVAAENVLSAEHTQAMIREIGYRNFKILFDTQNYYLDRGYNETELLEQIHPYVAQIHLKDGFNKKISSCLLGTGDVSFQETAQVIKRTGCAEWLLLENYYHVRPLRDLSENPFHLLERDVQTVKRIFEIPA